eukprot:CAMPEP_0197036038 /NCGR_PEP_ID=MMETSP1384-20130603/13659_1 /TAXON_ID=29189 /ORGANISM="Ammonia sp." /LENGTH=179 /DNA_ID=CAMNT_0042466165 /DNA_START=31 /DNA_END=570 /DNA_ORIENTATION=+
MASSDESTKAILAFATAILFFKMVITLAKQGAAAPRPPEDKALGAAADDELQRLTESDDEDATDREAQQPARSRDDADRPKTRRQRRRFNKKERWRRIVMNDLENIPIGLIILWVNLICDANGVVTSVCTILFVFCRIMHTVLYAYSLQPWRSVAYTTGIIAIVAASINLIIGALNGNS